MFAKAPSSLLVRGNETNKTLAAQFEPALVGRSFADVLECLWINQGTPLKVESRQLDPTQDPHDLL